MAYLDRSSRNWGAMIGAAFAVPAALLWSVIVLVGGNLECASTDAACGPGLIEALAGFAVIASVACSVGWSLNRLIGLARRSPD
jgi:hypothetical protein